MSTLVSLSKHLESSGFFVACLLALALVICVNLANPRSVLAAGDDASGIVIPPESAPDRPLFVLPEGVHDFGVEAFINAYSKAIEQPIGGNWNSYFSCEVSGSGAGTASDATTVFRQALIDCSHFYVTDENGVISVYDHPRVESAILYTTEEELAEADSRDLVKFILPMKVLATEQLANDVSESGGALIRVDRLKESNSLLIYGLAREVRNGIVVAKLLDQVIDKAPVLLELKNANYDDLEDLASRMLGITLQKGHTSRHAAVVVTTENEEAVRKQLGALIEQLQPKD